MDKDRKHRRALIDAYELLTKGGSRGDALLEFSGVAGDYPIDALEYKAAPAEFKAEGDQGVYDGHFSIFGNVDDGGDVTEPGAFEKTLQERGDRVKVFYAHDWSKLIGPTPNVLREDALGLHAHGRLTLGSFWGNEAWQLMKDGALKEGSYGYMTIKSTIDEQNVRHLWELMLFEISPVPLGMNALTNVQAVKAAALRAHKSAIPPKRTPINDNRDVTWDAAAVLKQLEGADELRMAHAWVDSDSDPDAKASYALPHHDADGKVIWKGLTAAAGALAGGRTRRSNRWPSSDVSGIQKHLALHYGDFDETPPWEQSGFDAEVVNLKALLESIKGDEALVTVDPIRVGRLCEKLDALVTEAQEWRAAEPTSKRHSALSEALELRARETEIALQLATR